MDKLVALLFSGLSLGAIYTMVALGIVVLYKATSVVNAAQFGLVSLGGYIAFWGSNSLGLSIGVNYLLVITLMAVVGVILERVAYAPLRRRPPETVLLTTLAGGFAIVGLIVLWQGPSPRNIPSPFGFGATQILGATVPDHSLFVLALTSVLVLVLVLLFKLTSFGRHVRALATDRDTARLQGIAVNRLSIITFALASAMAGLAGVLLAPLVALTPNMGFNPMLLAFGAAIIGGFGRLGGVVAGAAILGLVQQLGGGYISTSLRAAFPFLAILLVLAFRSEGLFGGEARVRL